MRQIPDTFASTDGTWNEYWTPAGVTDNAWIPLIKHVDLRSFINYDIRRRRTQSELDQYTQSLLETNPPLGTQDNIEGILMVAGEYWTVSGTGFTNSYDWNSPPTITAAHPAVGLISSPANLRALTIKATGAAIALSIVSSIANDGSTPKLPIDCSETNMGADNDAALVLSFDSTGDVLHGDLTAATSYVQLTSAPDGAFVTANPIATAATGYESVKVPFSSSTGGVNNIVLDMDAFDRSGFDPTDSFDPTAVTGIRIYLVGAAASNGDRLCLLHGVRITNDVSQYASNDHQVDFETRRGILMNQVALDGSVISTGLPPLSRGIEDDSATSEKDNRFVDGAIGVYFSTGGGLTQAGTNFIDLHVRETTDVVATRIVGRLQWTNTGAASYRIFRYDDDDGTDYDLTPTGGTIVGDTGTVSLGVTLDNAQDEVLATPVGIDPDVGKYYLQMTVIGTQVELRLFEADALNETGVLLANVSVADTAYRARLGRCGFAMNFVDYDAFLDELAVGTTGFATIRTKVFKSPTPVDGCKLSASFTPDLNLLRDVFWIDSNEEFRDLTKTTSGDGSYRTTSGLLTNRFLISDWAHSYISFDIWVPQGVTFSNQPYITLTASELDEDGDPISLRINIERLQGAQWNAVLIDLAPYRNQYANLFYRMSIKPPQDGGLGTFWLDSIKLGQRTVEWEMRAKSDAPWRSFRNLVNDPLGAVHLPVDERGREFQIQGTALTEHARIVNYKPRPHYAELGVPLFDQSFDAG